MNLTRDEKDLILFQALEALLEDQPQTGKTVCARKVLRAAIRDISSEDCCAYEGEEAEPPTEVMA